jgi:hypothetical protein
MSNQTTPIPDLPAPPQVAGISLDGAKPYLISAEENRALCESTGVAPAEDGTAHPIYFYIATQVGMGMTVAGLCAACDFDVEEGPRPGLHSRVPWLPASRIGSRVES